MSKLESISRYLLKPIDELTIGHHPYLNSNDEVYYLGEYTSGKLANYSPINRMILNYKKDLTRKKEVDWKYKQTAIEKVADLFRLSILGTEGFPKRINNALLVPIPPHKSKADPLYDDRNLRMLNLFMPSGNIHELVTQKQSREPLHRTNKRNIEDLRKNYVLNFPNAISFREIWLFDDILRHGTHYRAIHSLIEESFPNSKVVGFFIARSVYG